MEISVCHLCTSWFGIMNLLLLNEEGFKAVAILKEIIWDFKVCCSSEELSNLYFCAKIKCTLSSEL